jgi:hypothetical protein
MTAIDSRPDRDKRDKRDKTGTCPGVPVWGGDRDGTAAPVGGCPGPGPTVPTIPPSRVDRKKMKSCPGESEARMSDKPPAETADDLDAADLAFFQRMTRAFLATWQGAVTKPHPRRGRSLRVLPHRGRCPRVLTGVKLADTGLKNLGSSPP